MSVSECGITGKKGHKWGAFSGNFTLHHLSAVMGCLRKRESQRAELEDAHLYSQHLGQRQVDFCEFVAGLLYIELQDTTEAGIDWQLP